MGYYELIIVDVSGLAHASREADSGLCTSDGFPTDVIFHVLSTALSLGIQYTTNHFVWCFDSKTSKRRELLPSYKEKRRQDLSDEDRERLRRMRVQVEHLRVEVLPKIGFSNIRFQEGYEADDMIATSLSPPGRRLIVSNDGDLYQLLRKDVDMLTPRGLFTYSDFRKKYGIPPGLWHQVKAYGGCSSDNVPGIKGVGEGSALKYVRGTLTSGAYFNRIRQGEEDGTYRKMVALVKLPFDGTEWKPIVPDKFSKKGFMEVCKSLEFNSFLLPDSLERWRRFFKGEFNRAESIARGHRPRKVRRNRLVQ